MKNRSGSEEILRCSFCHKSQDAVAKLISSPSDYPARLYLRRVRGGLQLHPRRRPHRDARRQPLPTSCPSRRK